MNRNDIILSVADVKKADEMQISKMSSPHSLMGIAAKHLYDRLCQCGCDLDRIVILCGSGNNGGDGWALGCLLLENNFDVTVIYTEFPKTSSSIYYSAQYSELGGNELSVENDFDTALEMLYDATVIVDALYGIGFRGELTESDGILVNVINESEAVTVSVDLPSGLNGDSVTVPERCVYADITVTFTTEKLATVCYPTRELCGKVFVEDIGIPNSIIDAFQPIAYVNNNALELLPLRYPVSHKGTYGTLKFLCGSREYTGASVLALRAALRCGVGMVKLFTDEYTELIARISVPEAIVKQFDKEEFLISKSTASVIGCGIGRNYDSFLEEIIINSKEKTVVDADGINFLSEHINVLENKECDLILTPHEAELARLLSVNTSDISANRVLFAVETAKKYKCVVVLKGATTLIADKDGTLYINSSGNSGLAKGGSGDTLSGMIGGFAAQGVSAIDSARLGVYLHGASADKLSSDYSEYGILPSDLPEAAATVISRFLNK